MGDVAAEQVLERLMDRQPDTCFKCGRQIGWDQQINVPTKAGNARVCCLPCGLSLRGSVRRRMSLEDQRRLFAFGCRGMLPEGRALGLTKRDFAKACRPEAGKPGAGE
jgi:hypothetical protein